ncbi:MAG: hypothetical protein KDA65_19570, partial [Planctomycetaceae bacterium]|nr:hypothetical protein [Planctomycetaceae bacterium]
IRGVILMLHEYTVDPDSLASFNELWQALEQFGVSHGRLLVECPKSWWKKVKQNLNDVERRLPPMAYKQMEERFSRLKEQRKLIRRRNLQFDGNLPFPQALAAEHQSRPFRAVIQLDPSEGSAVPVLSKYDLHDGNILWKVPRSLAVPKTAKHLCEAVAPLLKISSDFLLIDPYFASRPEAYRSIPAMLRTAMGDDRPLSRIEIHTGTKGTESFIRDKFRAVQAPHLPTGLQIRIFQWEQREGGERLHDRYLLTDRGGVSSSYGWDCGDDGVTTEISLLDDATFIRQKGHYQEPGGPFHLVRKFTIQT